MRIREYDEIPAISNTWLGIFKQSPKHFQHARLVGMESTPDMVFGIAFHTYLLEPQWFERDVFVLDETKRPVPDKDYKTHANADWKRAQFAENSDKEVITTAQFELIKWMAEAIQKHELAGEILRMSQSQYECKLQWQYKGTACKSLLDQRHSQFINDYKTCQSADPDEWARVSFFPYGYDRQGGMYLAGDSGGELPYSGRWKDVFFTAVEKSAPYGVAVYQPSREVLSRGVEEYQMLVEQYAACVRSGIWEGYEFKSIGGSGKFDIQLPYYLRGD